MANLSSFLAKPAGNRPAPGQPGSNGFLRREFFLPGTFRWTAIRAGKVKLQGLGAAAGGSNNVSSAFPGASGAYGDKVLDFLAGQWIDIVVGAGSAGGGYRAASGKAGTTSISGDPVGPVPLVFEGAQSHNIAGIATGPWDRSFPGGIAQGPSTGGPSSASPFGPGRVSTTPSSPGWGGDVTTQAPTGSFPPNSRGLPRFILPFNPSAPMPAPEPWWDLQDIVNNHPEPIGYRYHAAMAAEGVGSAAGVNSGGLASALGGGTSAATNANTAGQVSGFGAGGGSSANRDQAGGPGGNSIIILFWDEVSAP